MFGRTYARCCRNFTGSPGSRVRPGSGRRRRGR
jgi:hypothetical protein